MKYKKDFGGLFVLLGFTWQVFDSIRSSYTPTQAILVVIFGYLGVRLIYFILKIANDNKLNRTITKHFSKTVGTI